MPALATSGMRPHDDDASSMRSHASSSFQSEQRRPPNQQGQLGDKPFSLIILKKKNLEQVLYDFYRE